MAESYSVKAILSAKDHGFSTTLKSATAATESLASKIKNGFAFGVLAGAGNAAFNSLTNGARNLVTEIDSSNAAWKTFGSNMQILGKSEKDINSAKKTLQEYAQQTVYSSSDMASTYAQLAAVGIKSTDKLVKGFGGLAAAAENPQQAMKTLSQQAVQMAAKPSVAWADFKLMLEQTPAGIAAVAKEMNMSTAQMVTKVQDGEISTQRFFDAINKVGNSDGFSKMATEAKTAGQAMDGLKETLGNKLTPAFDMLSQKAIKGINGISDKIAKIDGDKVAVKLSAGMKAAKPYWDSFVSIAKEVGSTIKTVGKFISEHKEEISKALPYVIKFGIAFKAFSMLKGYVAPVVGFTKAIGGLAGKGIGAVAGKLFGISKGQEEVGKSSTKSGKAMLAAAKSYALMGVAVLTIAAGFGILAYSAVMLANSGGLAIGVMAGLVVGLAGLGVGMALLLKTLAPMSKKLMPVSTAMLAMGAAVVLVSAGFALMAYSSIQLANAGGLAIGVMVGMVAAVALLAVGAAALGTALTAGAVGFVAFGAAMVLVGTSTLLAASALAVVAGVLPTIVQYGGQGALVIGALGVGMMVFASGAALAGVACVALGVGLAAFGVAAIAASVGVGAFGLAMVASAVGVGAMALSLKAVNSSMKSISKNAKATEKSLNSMRKSVKVVESGLDALGNKAKSAMNKVTSAFDSTAGKAKSAGQKVGTGFTQGMQSGLALSPAIASMTTNTVYSVLASGQGRAYSAGAYISKGFANGMLSQLAVIRSAAAQMAVAADKALRAKAKIHSPSRVSESSGEYYGDGWVGGILNRVKDAKRAAEKLFYIPNVATPQLAYAYNGELSADADYIRNQSYNITVVSELDGREVGRGTAKYTKEELDKMESRERRKFGKV